MVLPIHGALHRNNGLKLQRIRSAVRKYVYIRIMHTINFQRRVFPLKFFKN